MARFRLPESPANSSSLSRAFGFTVPEPFARVIAALYDLAGNDRAKCQALFAEATGLELCNGEARYPMTPAELFPFASLGVDGVHYGYVIHAPELCLPDYPVGELSPMDFDDAVMFVGGSTSEALENLMSFQLAFEAEQEAFETGGEYAEIAATWVNDPVKVPESMRRVSEALGIYPTQDKANRRYDGDGNGLPLIPHIPDGWRFLQSSDGVGVLAPERAFKPEPLSTFDPRELEITIQLAETACNEAYPATALYYLREGHWHNAYDKTALVEVAPRLINTYEALGRPLLAEIVERQIVPRFRI